MNHIFSKLTFLLTLLILASCVNQRTEEREDNALEPESDVVVGQEKNAVRLGEGSITQVVDDSEPLQSLGAALRATGLDETLSSDGPYTLFAPSNEAFEKLGPRSADELPAGMDAAELKTILLHHVVEGRYTDAELVNLQELTTLNGDKLTIKNVNNSLTIDGASIVLGDREADNGYVHIIDSVLVPSVQ